MRIEYHAFQLQKAGNAAHEYEDAFAPEAAPSANAQEFHCAVADGATETSFSGLWANILVDAFVDQRLLNLSDETITGLSAEWKQAISAKTNGKPLPWYAEEKLQQGAFSSLLGLSLRADGIWRSLCIGDSCLFHIRPREAINAFPYHTPEQFNNHPALLSTNAEVNASLRLKIVRGRWQEGDYFLLMTDALAHCFLSQRHLRSRLVAALANRSELEALIQRARDEHLCRNDDVTFLRVRPQFGDGQGGVA